jgi:hypothetical protein
MDLFEDPDVLLDPVEGQAERRRQLSDRGWAASEPREDAPPCRIRQREERPIEV